MLSRACHLSTPPASRQAWRSSLSSKRRPLLQPRHHFSHSPVVSKPYDAYRPIGIRREDKSRWERRAPLTPTAVALLIKQTGVKIYVQPSTKRIFSDADYARAGAIVSEDLTPAEIILGIKEVPPQSLLPDKTYVFFSHTHKGNEKNMGMLKSILDKNITLIDYELMTQEGGKRLVAFGKFAGNAGMIDALHGMGQRFLGLGYNSPFMYMSKAHNYRSLAAARLSLGTAGNVLVDQGTPKDFGPLVFAFTGRGNVAEGALEMFRELPHEIVPAEDLEKLARDKNPRLNKVYATQLKVRDYTQHKNGEPLTSFEDYLHHPEKYQSVFAEKIAPYVHTVVTGAYWDSRYPRLMTNAQLADFQRKQAQGHIGKGRMMTLADIVCDVKGAFECLSHTTPIDNGYYYYDAIKGVEHTDVEKPGTQIMGIDILPAELPIESSQHFSNVLFPHIKDLILPHARTMDGLTPMLSRATIAAQGKLTSGHTALNALLPSASSAAPKARKEVLLLGSGMVTAPLVRHLMRRPDVHVVVASNAVEEARALAAQQSAEEGARGTMEAVTLDISNAAQLTSLISKSDIVVSLVPAFLHAQVAQTCIEQKKHMVTASYVSPEMQALDTPAKEAGVTIMNEVGLDPGIDHMSAMKIIDEAKAEGKKIRSFVSWCGGLPAPEASNLPFSYKFSWSPRGVLTASQNEAIYLHKGKQVQIAGAELLQYPFENVHTAFPGFAFEGLANRNALGYADIYGLGSLNDMDTMFRGTLRYKGYSDLMYAFKRLGFLDLNPMANQKNITNWPSYLEQRTGDLSNGALAERLGVDRHHAIVERVHEALDFLAADKTAPYAQQATTPLDAFSALLAHRLQYLPGERDMVAMHHAFEVEDPKTNRMESITSSLVQYANPLGTAMARTVGVPAAMATELILDNRIPEHGVLRPTMPHVYRPILEQLEQEHDIRFVEQVRGRQPLDLTPRKSAAWS
ncbi:Saccharopine dehydrogenase-domain-containing protein [Syncephalastrum racemosum]|uniref:Saccharopine dehydrogenase-domain-containing protein n=1 Tax=Syncephalastrum racemosum TaxID=13706 RepID=A0A1X2HLA1_SYNRA|nr:Saccharopine dehydrogenase-domain-containing protein [Syncephalastrum racemosum]